MKRYRVQGWRTAKKAAVAGPEQDVKRLVGRSRAGDDPNVSRPDPFLGCKCFTPRTKAVLSLYPVGPARRIG